MTTAEQRRAALSARQLEVLRLAAAGETTKSIARELRISERTVRWHVAVCCEYLDTQNRTQAVARAVALRLVALDDQEP